MNVAFNQHTAEDGYELPARIVNQMCRPRNTREAEFSWWGEYVRVRDQNMCLRLEHEGKHCVYKKGLLLRLPSKTLGRRLEARSSCDVRSRRQ